MGNKMCSCKEEKTVESNNLDINSKEPNKGKDKALAGGGPRIGAQVPKYAKHQQCEAERVKPVVIQSGETQGEEVIEESPETREFKEFAKRKRGTNNNDPEEGQDPLEGQQQAVSPGQKASMPSDYEMRRMMKRGTKSEEKKRRRGKGKKPLDGSFLVIPVSNILTKEQMAETDPDTVLFESELMKYRPGLSIKYITRWCQVTKGQFMYFKNQWAANCWLSKPIAIIPLKYVKIVQRVKSVPTERDNNSAGASFKRSSKPEPPPMFEFEIFLKEEIDLVVLAQSNDSSAFDMRLRAEGRRLSAKKSSTNEAPPPSNPDPNPKPAEEPKEKDKEQEKPNLEVGSAEPEPEKQSQPEVKEEEGKTSSPPPTVEDQKQQAESKPLPEETHKDKEEPAPVTPLNDSPGHLMRDPNSRSGSYDKQGKSTNLAESPQPFKQAEEHSAVANNGNSWSNREAEWYSAEGRFLFASPSEETAAQWVSVLQWILGNK